MLYSTPYQPSDLGVNVLYINNVINRLFVATIIYTVYVLPGLAWPGSILR